MRKPIRERAVQQPSDSLTSPLIAELSRARRRTDALFARVPRELLYERPIAERHRLTFYIGHLEAFDANLLLREPPAAVQSPAALDRLFAFGIDPVDGQLPADKVEDWPPVTDIHRYAAQARERVDRGLARTMERRIDGIPLTTLLHTAIEHRLMHTETLAYMQNRLPLDKPRRPVATRERELSDDDMVPIHASRATLGTRPAEEPFAWDNEYQAHEIEVPAFAIDRYMVTNAQFRRFVDAGGYAESRWWTADDWRWRSSHSIDHPTSWRKVDGEWRHESLSDLVPFQGDWPVYVSHAEASAYARWRGKRLPTEAQWHRAAYGDPNGAERRYPWGAAAPDATRGNFDFERWDPAPVDAHPAGASALGVVGLLGNGWEWTSTPFAPFPGFQPFTFYPGYSADFFDGRHFVLKGGSAHTAARLLRRSFRNWFQPHYPYPFAGFRCVSDP